MLAQVSIVDVDGKSLLTTYVRPTRNVVDYRTPTSGIDETTPLATAPTFEDVKRRVVKILTGKVVVGFALDNDFRALQLTEPERAKIKVLDVQQLPGVQLLSPERPGRGRVLGLKALTHICLERDIQIDRHTAEEDAVASLDLCKFVLSHTVEETQEMIRAALEGASGGGGGAAGPSPDYTRLKDQMREDNIHASAMARIWFAAKEALAAMRTKVPSAPKEDIAAAEAAAKAAEAAAKAAEAKAKATRDAHAAAKRAKGGGVAAGAPREGPSGGAGGPSRTASRRARRRGTRRRRS